jgi:lipopolysaccharide transport system ATP-binding protein
MIRAENLHKAFKLYSSPVERLKEAVFRKCIHRLHHVLNGVSFEVAPGEPLGMVGQNGDGKSTLLKILTGVLLPDSGHSVRVLPVGGCGLFF